MPAKRTIDASLRELRKFGLAFPGAHTKSPWPGHLDLAVNDRTFAFLSSEGEPFRISCRLPRSGAVALLLPFASPTAYGLGKSGWVTASFEVDDEPPLDLLKAWIDESYRAQAPARLVARLGAPAPSSEHPPAAPSSPVPRRRPAARSNPTASPHRRPPPHANPTASPGRR